jgi:UDP-GlcNAc:undecaprenyl-phosphate GlcNAc-1-phosphate transferase
VREFLLTISLSAVLVYLITPFVKRVALNAGAFLELRSRDTHKAITPRMGGLAMWLSMAITLLIVGHLPLVGKSYGRELQGIFLAGTFIMILGILDDLYELDSLTKFAGQTLAAGILLLHGVQILWLPINGIYILPPNIGQVLTIFFVMVVINAVNFVDGLDGLATGIVGISAVAFFAFSYLLAVVNGFNRAGAPSLVTAIVIGICLGFLPHNYHPAKIFMGDSGAMLLGLLLSSAAITLTGQIDINAITGSSTTTLLPLLLPFAVLAIPLLDLGLAVIRRVRAGRSPFAADSEHIHHKLLDMGHSHRRTAGILYLWTAAFAIPAVVAAFAPLWVGLLLSAVIFAFSIYLLKGKDLPVLFKKEFVK